MGLICPEDYALRPLSTNCQLGCLSAVLGTLCFFPQGLISLPTRPQAQAEPHTAMTIEAGGAHAGHFSWTNGTSPATTPRAACGRGNSRRFSIWFSILLTCWHQLGLIPEKPSLRRPHSAATFYHSHHLLSLTHSCTHTRLLQRHHLEVTDK